MCMFLGLYSYISDITDEKTRTIRIAILDFVFFTGMSIGSGTYMRKYLHLLLKLTISLFCSFSGVSGEILAEFGYEAIYGSASILHVIAIIYAFTFVKESDKIRTAKGLPERNVRKTNEKASCGSIFTFKHIKESFSVAFKRRPGGLRHVIVICVSLFGIYSLANNGISSINIPYAKAQFEWNNGTDESSSGTDSFTKEYAKIQSIGKSQLFFSENELPKIFHFLSLPK